MGVDAAIDITAEERKTILALLQRHLPGTAAWVYGSRAKWTSRPQSDLDLVVFATPEQRRQVGDLREALEESNLPFRVDLFVWDEVPESFRERIEGEHVVLVERKQRASDQWREVTIGEIADVVGGSTPSTKNPDNFDGDIPWLTPKDLSGPHDRYVVRGKRNLSQHGLNSCSATLLPTNSVLLSTRAPIGYVALAKNPIASNQEFRSLVLRNEGVPEYLYYWLLENTEELERHASGSTFQELSGTALKNIRLRLPPLPEQRAIAHILGTLDDKIELNRRMNETLEAMAQAIFKDWFIDFGPVRAKMEGRGPYLASETWDLFPDVLDDEGKPVGWWTYTLSDLAHHHRATLSPRAQPDRIYEHYSIPAYDAENAPAIDLGGSIKSNKTIVPEGAVLLSKLNPEIERVWLPNPNGEAPQVASTEFLALTPVAPATCSLLYCLFRSRGFRVELTSMVTGTSKSHQRVSSKALLTREVLVAESQVLNAFDQVVRLFTDRMLSNRRETRTLTQTRDLLLPKLMSGEIRLRDAEKAVGVVAW